MNGPRSNKAMIALAVAVIGALISWYSKRDGENPPRNTSPSAQVPASARDNRDRRDSPPSRPANVGAAFDFYLLSMSWHPAFCSDGHENKPECRITQAHPLALHGLWPEKLQPGAYPHDCAAPHLDLQPELARELEPYMPGMDSNLHEHEWRTHGGCTGLDDDAYFQRALDLAITMDVALRATLTTLAGRETTAAQLRGAANRFREGFGQTIVFQCRTMRDAPAALRNKPFLIEVRQCIDDDGPNHAAGTLLDCATVDRRDQGCGRAFQIADTR